MNAIDWVQLWLLNRTISMECETSLLIRDIAKEPFNYWRFPTQPVFRVNLETRIAALKRCISNGLIQIYPEAWLQQIQFRQNGALNLDQCEFHDSAFLERTQATLTVAGHDQWEAEFQPDWRRYWHTDDTPDQSGSESILYVAYASNEIYQELVAWLPDYFSLDQKYGLQELGCKTVFQYQATKWKILPLVKVVAWKVKLDDTFSRIALESKTAASQSDIQDLRQKMTDHFRESREKRLKAIQVLERLSGKWDCATEPGGGQHDTIPDLRSPEMRAEENVVPETESS